MPPAWSAPTIYASISPKSPLCMNFSPRIRGRSHKLRSGGVIIYSLFAEWANQYDQYFIAHQFWFSGMPIGIKSN
jgi:hypothetical protein